MPRVSEGWTPWYPLRNDDPNTPYERHRNYGQETQRVEPLALRDNFRWLWQWYRNDMCVASGRGFEDEVNAMAAAVLVTLEAEGPKPGTMTWLLF